MPKPASRKQYRYMMAILHGKPGSSARGDRVPKSIAEQYDHKPDNAPESKGKEHEGGVWSDKHHKNHEDKKKKKVDKSEGDLEKNIIRRGPGSDVTYQVTHGDALKIIGTGTFRFLKDSVKGMTDEDFRDIQIDNCTLKIRKHVSDVYSGRIEDGHKIIHQFTNKSLPAVAAEIMSVFEWYSPEDADSLDSLIDDSMEDDAVTGGITHLVDEYKRHNLASIYEEMESIRKEIRHGNAVDLQQVEQRIMKLFDKLEQNILSVVDKHNKLSTDAGEAIDLIEGKLKELQDTVDNLGRTPNTVEAVATNPPSSSKVYNEYYSYLSRPVVDISPNGHIKISFEQDWSPSDKENFLSDMRAKAIKKSRK